MLVSNKGSLNISSKPQGSVITDPFGNQASGIQNSSGSAAGSSRLIRISMRMMSAWNAERAGDTTGRGVGQVPQDPAFTATIADSRE